MKTNVTKRLASFFMAAGARGRSGNGVCRRGRRRKSSGYRGRLRNQSAFVGKRKRAGSDDGRQSFYHVGK